MAALDLVRVHRELYQPPRDRPVLVDVPEQAFLMVDGAGDPNVEPRYAQAVEALYSLSYALKFAVRKEAGVDYKVLPLEGLWWSADLSAFTADRKADWQWTMMIAQPDPVDAPLVERVHDEVGRRKWLPALDRVRFERFDEGQCAQAMHIGPYAAEGPTIERLHAFVADSGLRLRGKHHEIYLGDPRRAAPERLRTVLRQPVRGRRLNP